MKFVRILSPARRQRLSYSSLFLFILFSTLLNTLGLSQRVQAQTAAYCQLSAEAIAEKEALLQESLEDDRTAQRQYKALISEQADELRRCRSQTWPQNQAIWLRLYPCDVENGALDRLLDRIVNRGYNQVYIEVFYNGQVLLPTAENRTPWPSVVRTPGHENTDLLAQAIAKGRERGLKVYAWMFMLNFGYSYTQRPGAEQILARNGYGQTSVTSQTAVGLNALDASGFNPEEAFVDPYNNRAKQEYYALVQSVLRRQPDGVLFDYVRYPRGTGASSVASRVQDLWIYNSAAQQALYDRALNQKGRDLIQRYVSRGYVTEGDLQAMNSLYPTEGEPMWQGRQPTYLASATPEELRPLLQVELWHLTVAHAIQGVLDFLNMAAYPVQRQGIPAGAVFFPEGNQTIGQQGYDSRLQPWDRFSNTLEWHPMSYGICGHTGCIVSQVQRVISMAPTGTQIKPVLAGTWGQSINGRPSLEAQMQAIRQATPQINSISHFAYSWQEPQSDRERKFCQLR